MEIICVIKDSALIRIEHRISLLQQQVWNVLLAFAFDRFDQDIEYKIPVVTLLKYIPSVSNRMHLEKAVTGMVGCPLRFDVLQKAGKRADESFSLLSTARFKAGICYYRFPGNLKRRIDSPSVYSEIDLSIQKGYRGGSYGWFLYELCFDAKGNGKTGWISLSELRGFLGITPDRYPLFKDLNKRVIKQAIKDVNSRTDLTISAEFKRERRTVTGIQFDIASAPDQAASTAGSDHTLKKRIFQEVMDNLTMHSDSYNELSPINRARLKSEIFHNYISRREELSAMISDTTELADSFHQQQMADEPKRLATFLEGRKQPTKKEMTRALEEAEGRIEREKEKKRQNIQDIAEARRRTERWQEAERVQRQRDIEAIAEAGRDAEQRLEMEKLREKEEIDDSIRKARRKGIERLKHLLG
ncbi:MAG: RepB family plasmid replication initiator protein [Proteobacteria bacterium]|nr:RepB family plasmid replication initiator protein [Pseudomonadota bacterium]